LTWWCQSTIRFTNYYQFCGYWQCKKCWLMAFSYFLFINLSNITSGRIKKKEGKTCVDNPADLEAALPETRGDIAQQAATRKYCVQSFTLQFRLSYKFSQSSLGLLSVLSEDEGHVLVRWISDCSRKGFTQKKLCVQLSVKQFLPLR